MPGKSVRRGRAFRQDSCPDEKGSTSLSIPLRAFSSTPHRRTGAPKSRRAAGSLPELGYAICDDVLPAGSSRGISFQWLVALRAARILPSKRQPLPAHAFIDLRAIPHTLAIDEGAVDRAVEGFTFEG